MAGVDFAAIYKSKKARKFLEQLDGNAKEVQAKSQRYIRQISPNIFADIISHFSAQQSEDGPWDKWSAAYADQQSKRGRSDSNNILKDTGFLRQSLIPGVQSPGSNTKVQGGDIVFFNPAKTKTGFPYAFAHDNDGPRRSLPRRQFMWASQEAVDLVAESTLDFITKDK